MIGQDQPIPTKNVHHLKIQVSIACCMTQELTIKHCVGSTLLSKALLFIQKQSAHITRLIEHDHLLAVKIVSTLDMELQHFFKLILDHEGPKEDMDKDNAHYTANQLKEWLFGFEVSRVPFIILLLALGGGNLIPNKDKREQKRQLVARLCSKMNPGAKSQSNN